MCDCDDFCKKFSKFLLVLVNLFFFLLGLLMLAFGIAMVAAPDKVAAAVMKTGADISILGNANFVIKAAGIFMIVLGGIVGLIGCFGFFGACCENRCLLITYLIIVIIVLLAEVALIIFAAVYPDKLKDLIQDGMNDTLITDFNQDVTIYPNVTLGSNATQGYSWAVTQFGAKCCGVYKPEDYQRLQASHREIYVENNVKIVAQYPISCCKLKSGIEFPSINENSFVDLRGCVMGTNMDAHNANDCYSAIYRMIQQASRIAIGIAAAIIGFEIIIIVLAVILCCAIQNGKSFTV